MTLRRIEHDGWYSAVALSRSDRPFRRYHRGYGAFCIDRKINVRASGAHRVQFTDRRTDTAMSRVYVFAVSSGGEHYFTRAIADRESKCPLPLKHIPPRWWF